MATNEELQKQVDVQCASLDLFHLLQEKWRKRETEMINEVEKMIDLNGKLISMNEKLIKDNLNLQKINDSLIKLGDRLQEIIEAK